MKLLSLDLLAYGPFTETSIDLSGGDCGLHVIFGPNEAGKSSTLRAIHGLLFGIRANTTDNFLHDNRQLRIGGCLRNSEGDEFRFVRRKGNRSTLLNPDSKTGAAWSDDAIAPFLRGIDRDTFTRVYGIDRDELKRGGSDMAELRGLVGESLFAATVGGSGLARLMKSLDEEARALFDSRRRTSALRSLAARHRELASEIRNARLSVTAWERIRRQLRDARRERDDIIERETSLGKDLSRLTRIRSAVGLISRRKQALQRIGEIGEVTVLPEHYSAEERNRVQLDLARVRQRLTSLSERLDGPGSLAAQIEELVIPEGLLECEDAIEALRNDRAVVLEAVADADGIRREMDSLSERVSELLRELGSDVTVETVEQWRMRPEDRVRFQELAADEKQRREQPARVRAECVAIEARLAGTQRRLTELKELPDSVPLRSAHDAAHRVRDLPEQLAETEDNRDALVATATASVAALGLWSGDTNSLRTAEFPLVETVERFAADFAELNREAAAADVEMAKTEASLEEVRQQIRELTTTESVPSESELRELRQSRDQLWEQIRTDWLRDAFGQPIDDAESLAGRYDQQVRESDLLADRLRREAARVAQLASHTARESRLEKQRQRTAEQIDECTSQRAALEEAWAELWRSAGVPDPLTPAEMSGWLRRLQAIRADLAQIDRLNVEVDRLQADLQSVRTTLRKELRAAGVTAGTRSGLGKLLALSAEVLEERESQRAERERLEQDLKRDESALAAARREERTAAAQLAEWEQQWASCVEKFGCPGDVTAAQANARLESLNRLFDLLRQMREAEARVREIASREARFAEDAGRLAERFSEPADDDPAETTLRLESLLQSARRAQSTRESLEESLQKATAERTEAEAQERELIEALRRMCEVAGVSDAGLLPETERRSGELSEQRRRLNEIDEQLHELAAGTPLDAFLAEAEAVDVDELPLQIERLTAELDGLKERRDKAVVAVNELESDAAAANGNDQAAILDQDAIGVISSMQDQAAQYIRVRLASAMLKRQIEIHRAENEDPLLQRASDLFSRMTRSEFAGLRTAYDEDQPVIVGYRSTGEQIGVDGMSAGTRDQLYLALRLAYVERQLVQFEPMPFVVDDILVQFDDARAAATLEVLGELSEQTQVIFLTHHNHLVELARETLPEQALFVHAIDSRPDRRVVTVSPQRPR